MIMKIVLIGVECMLGFLENPYKRYVKTFSDTEKLSNLISVVVLKERINIIRIGNNIKIHKTILIV